MSRPVDGSRIDPAAVGVHVYIAAADDGHHMSAREAVAVFEDGGDAQRGRRFDDEASVLQRYPHSGDDRCFLDQDGVVADQEEVVEDLRNWTPAGDRPQPAAVAGRRHAAAGARL